MSCYKYGIPSTVVGLDMLPGGKLNIKGRRAVSDNLKSRGARWGDVAKLEVVQEYRNDGVYIFDGDFILDLDYKQDDYGAVPSMFTPIEMGYPLNYWRCIDNAIIWVHASTIRKGMVIAPHQGPRYDYMMFRHRDVDYYIVGPEYENTTRANLDALLALLHTDQIVVPFELVTDPDMPPNTLAA